jgi:hypothetical protein
VLELLIAAVALCLIVSFVSVAIAPMLAPEEQKRRVH